MEEEVVMKDEQMTTEPAPEKTETNATTETAGRNLRKVRQGIVVSDKMDKTIIVAVQWKEKHPLYGKFISKTKRYYAHDEDNDCHEGDTVRIMETRPLSKTKRWRVVKVVERAK